MTAGAGPKEPGVRLGDPYRVGETVVVAVRGELTREGYPGRLRSALLDWFIDDGVRRILIDLSGATAIDLQGLGALLALRRESERHGKVLAIEDPSPTVRSRLEETGTLEYLRGSPRAG